MWGKWRKDVKTIELDPKCFKDDMSFAVTNRGHLIPCCQCDDLMTMNDPEFQKLLAVSKISEHESIDAILRQKEWTQFFEDLKNHKGPDACRRICLKNKGADKTQLLQIIDPSADKVVELIKT